MKKVIVGLAISVIAAGIVPVHSSSPQPDESKFRGGLAQMLKLGYQPDQRLSYLIEDRKPGDFVVYVVTDGAADRFTRMVSDAGARIRWTFRSVDAISAVASHKTLLKLASKPWVRALYPVLSGRVDDTQTSISGTMTRGEAPRVHQIPVDAGAKSVTVDLAVTPPGQAHNDFNEFDYLEATLETPAGRTVIARPSFFGQIAFRYGEPSLQAGTWNLRVWYRRANHPTVSFPLTYSGSASVTGEAAPRSETAEIPADGCAGARNADAWRKHSNLKKRSITDIGAPVLWDRGIRGRGVRVAVLDTGTDASHVDLDDQDFERWDASGCAPKVIADALFTGGEQFDGQGIYDTGGHGTHVSGEIGGTAEGTDGDTRAKFPGVAPEASIIAGRIAVDVTALSDDMLAGAEWAVIDQQADVVNLSFGIDVRYGVLTDRFDPQALGFEALATNPAWGYPTIMVSAGNAGDTFSTIGAPTTAPHVNTIAASVKDWNLALNAGETFENNGSTPQSLILPAQVQGKKDAAGKVRPSIATFSSRGPSQDLAFAPDFAAPGVSIWATKSNQTDPETQNGYVSFSGTSMAAPHASGVAALVMDGYRKAFGTSGAFGNRPPFWLIAAALSNTAWESAPRPAFAGGKLAKVTYADSAGLGQMFGQAGSRESGGTPRPVGSLVEGAGRVNAVAALDALTNGLLVYTGGNLANPAPHEFQPNLQMGTAKPTERVTRTLALDPSRAGTFSVTFRAAPGVPSLNASPIPNSWWSLPGAATVSGAATSTTDIALTVPAGTKPGLYTGYVLADIKGPGGARIARLPALVSVEAIDLDAGEGDGHRTTINGFEGADFPSPYVVLVIEDGVNNDWVTYSVDVPANLQRLDVALSGVSGLEEWDLFVYDRYGVLVADTFQAIPGNASLSLPGLAPGEYRIVVSRTMPDMTVEDADMRGAPFALTIDLVGAATVLPKTEVKGVKRTQPRVQPRPGVLPATGVADSSLHVLGVLGLAMAGAVAAGLRRRSA